MAQRFKAKTLISNSGVFNNELTAPNLVYNTGNQNISGVKNFYSRPTINGTGILISGEAGQIDLSSTVRITGDQTISGVKTFSTGINAPNLVYNTGNQSISGQKSFSDGVTLYGGATFSSAGAVFYNSLATDVDIDLLNRPYSNTRLSIGQDTGILGESINSINNLREIKIWETGGYDTPFSFGPFIRIGPTGTIISEEEGTKLGIGTKFPIEKVHISGGNLRVEDNLLVSGTGIFKNRPTVNGTGVLLSGEAAQVDLSSTVRTTGNQTVSGIKTFIDNQIFSGNIQVSGTGIFKGINLDGIDNLNLSGVDITITSGSVSLTNRPTVNGTGVLLSGETAQVDLTSTVRTTGNQTVSGIKTFANPIYGTTTSGLNLIGSTPNPFGSNILISGGSGNFYGGGSVLIYGGAGVLSSGAVDLRGSSINMRSSTVDFQNSPIANASAAFLNQTTNFTINAAFGSDIVLVNSTSQVTGTISSGLANGFNLSIHQIGTGQVVITGSGLGVTINSYGGQYKTAGQYAAISLLHTGNNGYLMYGNTAL